MSRSTSDVAWFTEAVLKFLDIRFQKPYTQVVDLSKGIAFPQWCVGGQLNIAHNCVDKHFYSAAQKRTAIIYESEEGQVRRLTYGQLYEEVNRCANMLRAHGFKKGDSIGLFMPMIPEIVIALLAIRQNRRHCPAIVLRLRRSGDCLTPQRCERQRTHHRRWSLSSWTARANETRRR